MWKRTGLVSAILILGLPALLAGCSKSRKNGPCEIIGRVMEKTLTDEREMFRSNSNDQHLSDFAGKMRTIYFDFDKSDIRADQVSPLEGNANYLKKHADLKILIEGHCDEQGSAEYNFALGERRASSVRDLLISRGVAADRLSMVSKGEEEPAVEGHDAAAWSKNRRSAFKVTFKVTN